MSAANLAKLIVSRDSFDHTIQFMLETFLQDAFHPDFIKELKWILEGQFQKFLEIMEKNLETIYTPEEIDTLYQLHLKYPWLSSKAEKLGMLNATETMDISKKTAELVIQNLKETGDLDRILQEGFYINEQEEFPPN